jgi:HSP20 family protein
MTLMRRAADRRPATFRDPFRDAMASWFGGFSDPFESWTGTAWPAMDFRETDDSYVVEVELPGMRPEDTEIVLDGRTLTIHGEFGEEHEQPTQAGENGANGDSMSTHQGQAMGSAGARGASRNRYLVRERRRGTFVRAITLPSAVDAEQAASRFENGELVITLPKAQQARARHIEIQGASRGGGQSSMKTVSGQSSQAQGDGQNEASGNGRGSSRSTTEANGSEDEATAGSSGA